jgi:hypothetical protein
METKLRLNSSLFAVATLALLGIIPATQAQPKEVPRFGNISARSRRRSGWKY